MNSSIIISFNYILCLSYRHLPASRAAQTTKDTWPAENNDDTRAAILLTTRGAETNDKREAETINDIREAETINDTREAEPINDIREAETINDTREAETINDTREAETTDDTNGPISEFWNRSSNRRRSTVTYASTDSPGPMTHINGPRTTSVIPAATTAVRSFHASP